MRIPLDNYQILCVPTKATTAQITQAYRDRLSLALRSEHSPKALAGRRHIIEQAFTALTNADERATVDGELLSAMQVPSPLPNRRGQSLDESAQIQPQDRTAIEVRSEDRLGAFLLLLELGKYEQLIHLATSYLENMANSDVDTDTEESIVQEEELRLCSALAYHELSREQWQQQLYGKAAISGETGLAYLNDVGLFESVQVEIQAELSRLKPYQILELLSLPMTSTAQRSQGLEMLNGMIDARGGIDGSGDDQSGLGKYEFLQYIQQLRLHLTVEEQLYLFLPEAQRQSPAGSYLSIYGLLAEGFSQCQPQQIAHAQTLLQEVDKRQDVYLEQSICALLLGQPGAATTILTESPDTDLVKTIQSKAADGSDLLQGLCIYGEEWLKGYVFSFFRDLRQHKDDATISLGTYFTDSTVMSYLEERGFAEEPASPEKNNDVLPSVEPESRPASKPERVESFADLMGKPEADTLTPPATTSMAPLPQSSVKDEGLQVISTPKPLTPSETVISPEVPPADSISSWSERRRQGILLLGAIAAFGSLLLAVMGILRLFSDPSDESIPAQEPLISNDAEITMVDPADIAQSDDDDSSTSGNSPETEGSDTVSPDDEPVPSNALMDEAIASEILQTWFDGKSVAFSPEGNIAQLAGILAEPSLSEWRFNAQAAKDRGTYRDYSHNFTVESVQFDPDEPDVATVEAQVQEKADFYDRAGVLVANQSYDASLKVRYELVREGERWLVKSSQQI